MADKKRHDNGGQANDDDENVLTDDMSHDRIVLPPPSSSSSAAALSSSFINLGGMMYNDNSIIHNTISPLDNTNIICINSTLGIYVIETNMSSIDCASIINTADAYARSRVGGLWSSYTYAKQTLGCRENDRLAYICAKPVLTACATIRHHLRKEIDDETDNDNEEDENDNGVGGAISSTSLPTTTVMDSVCQSNCNDGLNATTTTTTTTSTADPIIFDVKDETGGDSSSQMQPQQQQQQVDTNREKKEKELVLDIREPHVVKYDTINTERRKLDMHTDKSEWTFIIALSQGGGNDYCGGGTYFQALDSTIHLRQSQMLVFRGKLRHCGVTIQSGCRYLLVGFLVPRKSFL